ARPGVLADYYGASEVAFVGGSLVPVGGHNPLEPAARGAAVMMGRHVSHQLGAVERLREQRAIVIVEPREVGAALERLAAAGTARGRARPRAARWARGTAPARAAAEPRSGSIGTRSSRPPCTPGA